MRHYLGFLSGLLLLPLVWHFYFIARGRYVFQDCEALSPEPNVVHYGGEHIDGRQICFIVSREEFLLLGIFFLVALLIGLPALIARLHFWVKDGQPMPRWWPFDYRR